MQEDVTKQGKVVCKLLPKVMTFSLILLSSNYIKVITKMLIDETRK